MPHALLTRLATSPWALEHTFALTYIHCAVQAFRGNFADIVATTADAQPEVAAIRGKPARSGHAVAVIPLSGVLQHRPASRLMRFLGLAGTSMQEFTAMIRAADRDPEIGAIVLNVNSPGGSVLGVTEAAAELRRVRTPVVAVANTDMASAAYWLAAGADQIVATPSARVGSIGAVALHRDISAALEAAGVKFTAVASGEHKLDGHEAFALSESALAELRADVNRWAGIFQSDVARGRGISRAAVAGEKFGQGRVFGARDALARGMVDAVGTLEDAVRMAQKRPPAKRVRGRQRSAGATFEEIAAQALEIPASDDLPAVVQSACARCDAFIEAPGVEALAAILGAHECQTMAADISETTSGDVPAAAPARRRRRRPRL